MVREERTLLEPPDFRGAMGVAQPEVQSPVSALAAMVYRVDSGTGVNWQAGAAQWSEQANSTAWQKVIDEKLIEWGRDRSLLEDDDLPAPSRSTIGLACEVAAVYRNAGSPPPQRVCADASGGIVFERATGHLFQAIHVRRDGRVELATFDNTRLRSRVRIL